MKIKNFALAVCFIAWALSVLGCKTPSNPNAVLDSVVNVALPLAANQGMDAAKTYVLSQALQGSITQSQAADITAALQSIYPELAAYKSPAAASKAFRKLYAKNRALYR